MRHCRIFTLLSLTASLGLGVAHAETPEAPKINADFRYRHELVDREPLKERHRHRIRARLKAQGAVNEKVEYVFRVASGDGSAISTNQTLDDADSKKTLTIDLAYIDFKAGEKTNVKAGKMENPLYKPSQSELIWDNDLTPEGAAVNHQGGEGSIKYFVNAASTWLDERSQLADSGVNSAQAGANLETVSGKFTVGAASHAFTKLKGNSVLASTTSSLGNSATALKYTNDYDLTEVFAEYTFTAGDYPVVINADYVTNNGPSTDNVGTNFGVGVGDVKKQGWSFWVIVKDVEKDAVVGALTDSDFADGGTDGKGNVYAFTYNLAKNTDVRATYYDNEIGHATPINYKRGQLDLSFKY